MPEDNAASPARNRLTKERPEVRLAQGFLMADLDPNRGRYFGEDFWRQLVDEIRRLWNQVRADADRRARARRRPLGDRLVRPGSVRAGLGGACPGSVRTGRGRACPWPRR